MSQIPGYESIIDAVLNSRLASGMMNSDSRKGNETAVLRRFNVNRSA